MSENAPQPVEMNEMTAGLEIDGYFVRSIKIPLGEFGLIRTRLEDPNLTEEILGTVREGNVLVLKTIVWDEAKTILHVFDVDLDPQKRDWNKFNQIREAVTEEGFQRLDLDDLDKVVVYKPLEFKRA